MKADIPRVLARGSECDTTRALMLEASFVHLGALLQTSGILTLDVQSSRPIRKRVVHVATSAVSTCVVALAVCDAHPLAVSHRCFVCGEVWGDWILSPIGKSFERRLNLSGS